MQYSSAKSNFTQKDIFIAACQKLVFWFIFFV